MKAIRFPVLVLVGATLASGLFAQTHSHDNMAQKSTSKSGMMDDKMMAKCTAMMQKREQMKADMKAMDDKLDGMLATMNTATGSEKTDAIAAVVNEMVMQRKATQEKMASMQAEMMQHMMEHMQMGKQSMSMCPMMQAMPMPKSDTGKPDDHSKHHQP